MAGERSWLRWPVLASRVSVGRRRHGLCDSCPAFDGTREKAVSEKEQKMSERRRNGKMIPATDTSEFDREFIGDTFHPLSAADRARWERAKRKKPRRRTVVLQLETGLVDDLTALARKLKVSRDQLVSRGVRAILAQG